jgi:hypothetical protein
MEKVTAKDWVPFAIVLLILVLTGSWVLTVLAAAPFLAVKHYQKRKSKDVEVSASSDDSGKPVAVDPVVPDGSRAH